MIQKEEEIQRCAQSLYHIFGLVLSQITKNPETGKPELQPVLQNTYAFQEIMAAACAAGELCQYVRKENAPCVFTGILNCAAAAFPDGDQIWAIGPGLIGNMETEEFSKELAGIRTLTSDSQRIREEYEHLPVIPYIDFVKLCALVCGILTGEDPDADSFARVGREAGTGGSPTPMQDNRRSGYLYEVPKRDFHKEYHAEQFVMNCVMTGDVKGLSRISAQNAPRTVRHEGETDVMQYQNSLIALVTLCTRASIQGGLPVEIAYMLSDMYILHARKVSDIDQLQSMMWRVIEDYTKRVADLKRSSDSCSPIVTQSKIFILTNMYAPLKLTDVADEVGMNAEALSRRFRKEAGISIPDYIQKVKIEEAEHLLIDTKRSSSEIAMILGYSSQSQFITSFRKATGTTPEAYRKEHKY